MIDWSWESVCEGALFVLRSSVSASGDGRRPLMLEPRGRIARRRFVDFIFESGRGFLTFILIWEVCSSRGESSIARILPFVVSSLRSTLRSWWWRSVVDFRELERILRSHNIVAGKSYNHQRGPNGSLTRDNFRNKQFFYQTKPKTAAEDTWTTWTTWPETLNSCLHRISSPLPSPYILRRKVLQNSWTPIQESRLIATFTNSVLPTNLILVIKLGRHKKSNSKPSSTKWLSDL